MDDVTWIAEVNKDLSRCPTRIKITDPVAVMAVIGTICSEAYMDGFTSITTPELVAQAGVRADLAEQVIGDLIDLGIVSARANAFGQRVLEPRPSLRRAFRLRM